MRKGEMSKPGKERRVVIAGAGPVGMVCALALNKSGVAVTVFEQEPAPVEDQRAATIHPSTLEMLDALGVTHKILPLGMISSTYRFHDRVNRTMVAEFDLDRMRDELKFPFVLQYEQYKLTASIAAEYANAGDFDVRFSHSVTGLRESADGVEVEYTSPDGAGRLAADYVIGADGGRSTVRKLAGIEFEGFTYPEKFIKIATSFDFGTVNRDLALRNYFSDPDEWCNLFKVTGKRNPPGLWRAIFPVANDEPDEVSLSPDRIEARLQKFFPKAGRYDVEYVNVYPVSQRVAATFRTGRVLLAGDSAHVNNPIGGMGMNGGIHDGINLAEKLEAILRGEADDSLLDRYERQRRPIAIEYVQAATLRNKALLEEKDPAKRRQRHDELRRMAENPKRAREFLRQSSMIAALEKAAAVE
jgi:3-(3-hydroxy-phenyl)propionate hydroxylase